MTARRHPDPPIAIDVNLNVNVSSPMLAALVEMVEHHFRKQEKQMAGIRSELDRLRKAIDKANAVEAEEDRKAAELKADLEAKIADLQSKTLSAEEQAELDGMVAELEAMGGGVEDPPAPEG